MKKLLYLVGIAVLMSCGEAKESAIDAVLQEKVDSVFHEKMSEISAVSGQVVVMDYQTGEVVAMVGEMKKQESPLLCAVDVYNALSTGKVSLTDTVDVGEGIFVLDGDTIKDHNWMLGGYGKITLLDGVARKSKIAVMKALQIAGLEPVDSLVTPIEVAELFRQISKDKNVNAALRYCVTDGLGKPAASEKVDVAGMYGSCEVGDGIYAVEFCGYFPAASPRYVVAVSMNKKGYPASGAIMAGSVFRQIVDLMTE
jgi:cell division protein FtsI (penicillin-binding protein 3)